MHCLLERINNSISSDELLYFQAAVGVIYNPATKTQRFYQGHNDDIKCIALNPANPSIVATGQAAGHDEKEGDVCIYFSLTLLLFVLELLKIISLI